MVLIIIFWGVFFLLSLVFFIICLSNLEIEIKEFEFNSNNIKGKKIENYLIYLRLKLLGKITLLKLTIDDDRISKIKDSKIIKIDILKRVLLRNEKDIFTMSNIKHIEELEINKFNLKMEIDVIDTIITSVTIGIVSTFLSIILATSLNKYDKENFYYVITPLYKEKLQIIINLNCIINVKMVHIINILYMYLSKKGGDRFDGTSNRRAYDNCNEQYSRYGRCKYHYRRAN